MSHSLHRDFGQQPSPTMRRQQLLPHRIVPGQQTPASGSVNQAQILLAIVQLAGHIFGNSLLAINRRLLCRDGFLFLRDYMIYGRQLLLRRQMGLQSRPNRQITSRQIFELGAAGPRHPRLHIIFILDITLQVGLNQPNPQPMRDAIKHIQQLRRRPQLRRRHLRQCLQGKQNAAINQKTQLHRKTQMPLLIKKLPFPRRSHHQVARDCIKILARNCRNRRQPSPLSA